MSYGLKANIQLQEGSVGDVDEDIMKSLKSTERSTMYFEKGIDASWCSDGRHLMYGEL